MRTCMRLSIRWSIFTFSLFYEYEYSWCVSLDLSEGIVIDLMFWILTKGWIRIQPCYWYNTFYNEYTSSYASWGIFTVPGWHCTNEQCLFVVLQTSILPGPSVRSRIHCCGWEIGENVEWDEVAHLRTASSGGYAGHQL